MAAGGRPKARKSIAHLPSSTDDLSAFDQENVAQNATITGGLNVSSVIDAGAQKKTRSKSLGPGGLDALKEDAGNRRRIPVAALPKSILKPSIPLSPLREIPVRKVAQSPQTASPSRTKNQNGNLLGLNGAQSPSKQSAGRKDNTSDATEPDVSAADKNEESAAEAEQRERRKQQREEIQKQREARRKSMANRRVSFAPEATLHTWDLVDDVQDSTTSSASTNSTRRASTRSNASGPSSPHPNLRSSTSSGGEGSPATPSKQGDDVFVEESPVNQRDVHQKKYRRRSSGVPPMNFNNPDEPLSSPNSGSSPAGDDDGVEDENQESVEADGSSSSSDDEVGSLDDTGTSGISEESMSEVNFRSREGNAAQESGETEDVSMDIAEDTVEDNFNPFAKSAKLRRTPPATQQNMESVDVFSESFKESNAVNAEQSLARATDDGGDMSMDMTQAAGNILHSGQQTRITKTPKSRLGHRRQSVRARRRSSGVESLEDGTMDFTAAVGGIKPTVDEHETSTVHDQTNEVSMDFTKAMGGIQKDEPRSLARTGTATQEGHMVNQQFLEEERRASLGFADGGGDMDMTTALGKIESDQKDQPVDNEKDVDMDLTKPVGHILFDKRDNEQVQASPVTHIMLSPNVTKRSPLRSTGKAKSRVSIAASETGSPRLTPTRPGIQSGVNSPGKSSGLSTKSPATPSKQLTPSPAKPTTPGKTPPPKSVSMRSPSPKKLFQEEIEHKTASPAITTPRVFNHDEKNGTHTPSIILQPSNQFKRRASGIGADRDGLGSPRVASLLDRRTSIGESAVAFAPAAVESRGVRFDDPRLLEAEVSNDRREDERRESGPFIIEQEASAESDDKDVTANLREAFGLMTPNKIAAKGKGRKSLAVGSAKGLLGKRPAELDDDDDEDTPQQWKGREASPVKKVKLDSSHSKIASSGISKKHRHTLAAVSANAQISTPTISLTPNDKAATTPRGQGRFKDADSLPSAQKPLPTLGQSDGVINKEAIESEDREEKVRLQDFLNMTNIRFMDLTTTKRRHPPTPARGTQNEDREIGAEGELDDGDPIKRFEDAVAAGACTVPMLELFQHSCRELKKYISEGRDVVREIEAETYEENPPLFRKYMSAAPSERAVMDNQFRDMKTHARHVSKGMWYEWRMALLAGLKEGLKSTENGLIEDENSVQGQESLLQEFLPSMIEEHQQLIQERDELQAQSDEIADCDQEELQDARQQIIDLDEEIRAAKEELEEQRRLINETQSSIDDAEEAKAESLQAIKEAKRLREESRGWSVKEVNSLQANVRALEARYGWSLIAISGSAVTMTYRDQLELSFDVSAFAPVASASQESRKQSSIRLTYVADSAQFQPQPLTTEKRFFLQLVQAYLQGVVQHETNARDLLQFVSASWDRALVVAAEVKALDKDGITACDIVSDECLVVKSMMLLKDVQTKVNVSFELVAVASDLDVELQVKPSAHIAYGEKYREDRMREFLTNKVGGKLDHQGGGETWAGAVAELRKRLIARGKKT